MIAVVQKYRWPLAVVAFGLIAGVNILLRLGFMDAIMPGDNNVYAYIGHAMLQGEKLYSDLVDNKPPAIYITYMLAEKIWGYGVPGIVYLSLVFSLILLVFIFLILYRTHGSVAAFIGALFWALVSATPALDMDIPNTEFFISAFLLISLWAYIEALNGKERFLWIAGGAIAVASTYKTNVVFVLAGYCLALFWDSFRQGIKGKNLIKKFGYLLLPGILMWAFIILWFFALGRFEDFYNINVLAIKEYVGNIWINEAKYLASGRYFFPKITKDIWILAALTYAWFLFGVIKGFSKKYLPVYAAVFGGCLLMIGSTKASVPLPHYHQILVPFYCLLSAMFCSDVGGVGRNDAKKRWIAFFLVFTCAIFYLVYYQGKTYFGSSGVSEDPRRDDDRRLGQLLNYLTRPDEKIYQWGMSAGLYFYSRRDAASGIVLHHILYFAPPPIRYRLYDRLVKDVIKSKPAFFIFTSWAFRLDQEPWIQPFIKEYRFLGLFGKYAIFERKSRSTPAKELLAKLQIPPESTDRPWEKPQLILFPGWQGIALSDPERFQGTSLLHSGYGGEAKWVDEALFLFRQKRYIDARAILARALEINPDNLAAQAEMGVYNEATGQYFLALKNYETVAKKILHPFNEYYVETRNLLMQQAATIAPPDK